MTSTDPAPIRPQPDRQDPVRTALLDAARRVLAAEGPTALTVRRIAAEAGMSTMNVYSRFGGKDGVVDELFAEGFLRLGDAMRAVAVTGDAMADLRAAGRAYRAFALEHPTSYAVMFQRPIPEYEPSRQSSEIAQGTLAVLADLLERAMDAGALERGDRLRTAAAVWASCHGVVSLELSNSDPEGVFWPEVYETMQATVMRGLGARS